MPLNLRWSFGEIFGQSRSRRLAGAGSRGYLSMAPHSVHQRFFDAVTSFERIALRYNGVATTAALIYSAWQRRLNRLESTMDQIKPMQVNAHGILPGRGGNDQSRFGAFHRPCLGRGCHWAYTSDCSRSVHRPRAIPCIELGRACKDGGGQSGPGEGSDAHSMRNE